MERNTNVVAIIGRANVGKSTLFNRLIQKRMAIVDDIPGVTRDRLYAQVEWAGKSFYLVDTGGFPNEDEPLFDLVGKQIDRAIEEASVIIFVVDGREGILPLDFRIAEILRRSNRRVIVAVNKIDEPMHEPLLYEAFALGFEDVIGVSAEHNRNIPDLLDKVVSYIDSEDSFQEDGKTIKISIVGRPNVGKSSIFNSLIGEERAIVSNLPGTTRDPIDTEITFEGKKYLLIDTAGLRKKSRLKDDIEFYSLLRAERAIDRSDVVLLVLDVTELVTDQDKRIAGIALEKGKGIVVAINKWDLLPEGQPKLGDNIIKDVKDQLYFINDAPIVTISALSKRNLFKIFNVCGEVYARWQTRISTSNLNNIIRDIISFQRLPSDGKGRFLNIFYVTQVGTAPPSFLFFVNDKNLVDKPFERKVINELVKVGDFKGVPIRVFWKNRRKLA
ncbi:ribosome biogenesis GTPase Der [Acetomicrobium hydrogeniformans]|uniref:GTPase Der n=1 Tax=Acetomicrobium hydrogeniformans ATCC BAA-1850 TaxID=592015 RepID=A0A0T5XDB9_9BACT|nr:ribosome biogenesis GTPase Der [Acetomicrobium hydrogeniformans]KRT36244.1 ribosome biogenesis GTPase Der [Acetomicrobium hydrogeniformans ATCC BAA-1850]